MNRLIVFGDSWPWGADLEDPYTQAFPYLIGQILDVLVLNLSQPGTSIDHMVVKFLDCCKENEFKSQDKILFCFTGQSRSMYFDNNDIAQEIHPRGTSIQEIVYYKYLYSKKLEVLNLQKNILILKYISDALNIKSFFVSNWDAVPDNLYGNANFYQKTLAQILHPERNQTISTDGNGQVFIPSSLMGSYHHPTKLGHEKIAQELAAWIS
jgi:hypothetical protein